MPRDSSIIVVISRLRYLTNLGIPAIAITNDEDADIIQQVLSGDCIVVFGSPECLLSTTVWRGIFKCQSFTEKLI